MKVGDLVRYCNTYATGTGSRIGIIVKVHLRDIAFYKSHTYLVRFNSDSEPQWFVSGDLEVISESR